MDPNLWGPSAWYFLHSLTYSYPVEPSLDDKKAIENFFDSLSLLLPCTVCKTNYREHFTESPIREHSGSRETVVKWLIDIHNKVNIDTGKPKVEYETILKLRPPMYSSVSENIQRVIFLVLLILVIRHAVR